MPLCLSLGGGGLYTPVLACVLGHVHVYVCPRVYSALWGSWVGFKDVTEGRDTDVTP